MEGCSVCLVDTGQGGLLETEASRTEFQGNQSRDGSEAGRVRIGWPGRIPAQNLATE